MLKTSKLWYRLVFWIAGSVIVVLALITWLSISATRQTLENGAKEQVKNLVSARAHQVDGFLQTVARIPLVLADSVAVEKNNDETLLRARIRRVIEDNPEIYGSTVSFEPYYFHADQKYFAPYYYKSPQGIEYVQLGTDDYVYWEWEWYAGPKQSGGLYWTAPYFDEGGGNIWMTTASYPVVREGQFIGVATIDVGIDALGQIVRQIKVGEKGYALLIDQKGYLLASGAATQQPTGQSIQNWRAEAGNPEFDALVNKVLAGESGVMSMLHDPFTQSPFGKSERVWAIYTPIATSGWRLVTLVSVDEMLAPVTNVLRLTLVISGVGVALLVILIWVISTTISHPLETLRAETILIAGGDLTRHIPITTQDEIGQVGQAFNQMVVQLRELFGRLEERTTDLERRAQYLQAATEVNRVAASVLEIEPLIRQVVEAIHARFNLSYAGMYLVDETGKWAVLRADTSVPTGSTIDVPNAVAGQRMIEPGHRIPVGEGALDKSIRDARAQFAVASSEIVLPLLVHGRVIGALIMQSDIFGHELDAVLQIMADQIATTLENARLFAASQAAVETARRAYGELSDQAWQELRRAYQAQSYRSDERGVIVGPVTKQPEIERAAREGRVIQGDETSDQVRLAVPIKVRGNVIAVLSTYRPGRTGGWTAQETSMLEGLADQLGVALESARLYQDTQSAAARERMLGQVTGRMRETLDMETVLKTAVDEMRQALELEGVIVQLARPEATRDADEADTHRPTV